MKSRLYLRAKQWLTSFALIATSFSHSTQLPAFAEKGNCPVGVNVNSFQNFQAAKQDEIVEQLKASKVHAVRTSLRFDDKNLKLTKKLHDASIGIVFNIGVMMKEGTPERPKNEQYHIRAARPLSATDVERSREQFQMIFDKLDENGIKAAAVELGNELNWVDFNADFPAPGRGKAFDVDDLSHDPVGKQVAKGFLLYLEALAALKDVRDHSTVNRNTPIVTCGMASVSGGDWQKRVKMDGVTIPATYKFLQQHGVEKLVDGYGVHTYPGVVKAGDKDALAKREAELAEKVFPAFCKKPFWLTEWGFSSKATSDDDDKERTRSVSEIRPYLNRLRRTDRLDGMFWYVWNEPDKCSIYRNGKIMEAGRKAVSLVKDWP